MNRRFGIVLCVFFIPIAACALCASSCVSGGSLSVKETTEIIRGRVRIYGNEPHTYVGIETEDTSKVYAVSPKEIDIVIRQLQGHLIEFKAVMLEKPEGEESMYLKDGTVKLISWKIIE